MSTPYTPAAISYLRSNSSLPVNMLADMLGWDEDTLRRRAAAHGIDLAQPPSTNGHTPYSPPIHRPPRPPIQRVHRIGSDLTLDEIAIRLPRRQRQMFGVLRTSINGPFIHGREIVERVGDGMRRGVVSNCATSIKDRLEKTRWDIEVEYGLHGGYRLVTR